MRDEIRRKVLDLARRRGVKAATLADDEVIPETGCSILRASWS